MDRETFLTTLREARAAWEALLAEIGEARMLQTGVTGAWSVKDVVAHIMWSEREMINVCQTHVLAGSDLWQLTDDERNPIVVAASRDRSLDEILREEHQVYAQLLTELEKLSDDELNNAHHFRDMPLDWHPWQVIAGCTFKHYRDHIPPLRAWLDQQTARD